MHEMTLPSALITWLLSFRRYVFLNKSVSFLANNFTGVMFSFFLLIFYMVFDAITSFLLAPSLISWLACLGSIFCAIYTSLIWHSIDMAIKSIVRNTKLLNEYHRAYQRNAEIAIRNDQIDNTQNAVAYKSIVKSIEQVIK